nr:MAG: hypothetical protein DIU64_10885 [Caldicoprobacter oshimai]
MRKSVTFILCLVTFVFLIHTLLPTVALAEGISEILNSNSSENGIEGYDILSQGFDEYCIIEDTFETWYANLPLYTGDIVESKIDAESLKNRNFTDNKEDISLSVVSIQKNRLYNNEDERFKLWKNSNLTKPIILYNFDNSIYGYMYGIVDKNRKLIGYIVAGANLNAPPVLEYSLYPDKFLALQNEEKVYFSSATGYVISNKGNLLNASDRTPLNYANLNDLMSLNKTSSPDAQEILEQWGKYTKFAGIQNAPNEPKPADPPTEPSGIQYRISMDTSDYTWYNVCSYTSISMFFDALGRRIEPGFLQPGRPHSLKINDYLHSTYGCGPTFEECSNIILSYANSKKLTSSLMFSKYYLSAINGSSTNSAVFNKHKDIIQNTGLPTLVGYSRAAGTSGPDDPGGAHLMLGIGYTSDNFYIVRDTWTYDGTPIRSYYYNKTGYKFCVMGLTYTNSAPNTAWGSVVLRPGDSNFNVRRLKYFLNALYYTPGSLTSDTYDTTTVNAVKAFQSDNGLVVDGIVGPNTYNKLKTAHIMKYDDYIGSWRVLSQGKKGDDVAQLQIRLYEYGKYSGTVDGIFGPLTKAAVEAYQSSKGITVDGIVGSVTFQKLYGNNTRERIYKKCAICNPEPKK